MPHLQYANTRTSHGICALGFYLLFNMLYNYGMAINTDAGSPPDAVGELDDGKEDNSEGTTARRCWKDGCNGRAKPPRSHHCRTCQRCILKMDHHCPWVNNCVGFKNYRYFLLFLFYLAACCIYVLFVFPLADDYYLLLEDLDTYVAPSHSAQQTWLDQHFLRTVGLPLCWVLALSALLMVALLGGFHVFLLMTNQTTIEFEINYGQRWDAWTSWHSWKSPYDVGFAKNFGAVCGQHWLLWLWPCVASSPEGDGISFPQGLPPPTLWFPCISRCCPPWAICVRICRACRCRRNASRD